MAASTFSPDPVSTLALLLLATSAAAQSGNAPVEVVISQVIAEPGSGGVTVDLRVLNDGETSAPFDFPETLRAEAQGSKDTRQFVLTRADGPRQSPSIAPHSFVKARYHAAGVTGLQGAVLSIPGWTFSQAKIGSPIIVQQAASTSPAVLDAGTIISPAPEPAAPGDRKTGNAFVANLGPYEPIYAVYGPGTNTEARIQISFKYRLFGSRQEQGLAPSWRDGVYFAYTQRMFWDLGAQSSPFRNIDYMPELFYTAPPVWTKQDLAIGGQIGIRHESNGRAGLDSRSLNSIYVAPMAATELGAGYRLLVGPRLSFLVGDRSDNPDIMRYRGATSLFMEVGREDGLHLSTSTRLNFASGKGAFSTDISYPLNRLWSGGPDLYLFGQSFIGYGENLLDYDRNVQRFRIGLAIVR